jgi:hypothetical protein
MSDNSVLISAVKCLKCNEIIVSLAHHDFRSCGCGTTAIDGGQNYVKISFDDKIGFERLVVRLTKSYLNI